MSDKWQPFTKEERQELLEHARLMRVSERLLPAEEDWFRWDATVAQAEEQIERMSHRPNPWDGLVNALNGDDLLLDAAIDSFRDEAEMCLDIGGSSAGLSDYYSKIADGIERWLKMAEKLRQVEAERDALKDDVRELRECLAASWTF